LSTNVSPAPTTPHYQPKRIWPTLLAAAADAARRSKSDRRKGLGSEIYTAVILSRTSLDAHLHEMLLLRNLPIHVRFQTGDSSKRRLSASRWRMIEDARHTLTNTPRRERQDYSDVRDLPFEQKLQTLLLLLNADHQSPLVTRFEETFASTINLNHLRNAIVHHDFDKPSSTLKLTCQQIRSQLHISDDFPHQWETIMTHPEVGLWSCRTVGETILRLERLDHQRTIHFSATNNVVRSALSSLGR